MKSIKHFGYGSNLNLEFLRQYCPSAKFNMKAYLPNYEIQFRFWSERRNGGISTIIEAPGELVHGVIYEIPENELLELNILESVPQGIYTRETFHVLGKNGEWLKSDLYRVVDPKGPFSPSRSYVEQMLTGAKNHKLDNTYIKMLNLFLENSQ